MNIFVPSRDPRRCAEILDDKRVVKMVLETAQILSTVNHLLARPGTPYKITHSKHPCVQWALAPNHYNWLCELFAALLAEYTYRFKKAHKCVALLRELVGNYYDPFNAKPEYFVNCTTFKHIEDVHLAYRQYLCFKWYNDKRTPKWTNRTSPLFWHEFYETIPTGVMRGPKT